MIMKPTPQQIDEQVKLERDAISQGLKRLRDQTIKLENQRESMFLVVDFASNFFQETLWNSNEGKNIAKTYFSERDINDKSIKNFNLGYSSDKADSFALHAIKNGYNKDFLDKTGLVIYNKNKGIDRFRGRVIFPIKSISGRIQGFGARLMSEKSKKPHYLKHRKFIILNTFFHLKRQKNLVNMN